MVGRAGAVAEPKTIDGEREQKHVTERKAGSDQPQREDRQRHDARRSSGGDQSIPIGATSAVDDEASDDGRRGHAERLEREAMRSEI